MNTTKTPTTQAMCPKCGKPITNTYRKGYDDRKEHIVCPKPVSSISRLSRDKRKDAKG